MAPLELVQSRDISAEVVRGLDRNAQRSNDLVTRRLPQWLHSLGRDFAGVPGSRLYRAFQREEILYHSYCFVKPPEPAVAT